MSVQEIPTFFRRGLSLSQRFVIFVVLSLGLLVADTKIHALTTIRATLSEILYPLQWLAMLPVHIIDSSQLFLTRQHLLVEENQAHRRNALRLKAKLVQFEQIEIENAKLRKMLKLTEHEKLKGMVAQVRYHDHNVFSDRLVIDRGKQEGIEAGQPVLGDSAALLGQVVRTQAYSSEIRLISDRNFPVPVMVARNGLRAIVYGSSIAYRLEIRFLPFNSDIRVGDKLLTSGLDGVYPVGIPVAIVKSVKSNPHSTHALIECVPFANPLAEDYVFIVTQHRLTAENVNMTSLKET